MSYQKTLGLLVQDAKSTEIAQETLPLYVANKESDNPLELPDILAPVFIMESIWGDNLSKKTTEEEISQNCCTLF